jgi:hypothetical protein
MYDLTPSPQLLKSESQNRGPDPVRQLPKWAEAPPYKSAHHRDGYR